MYETFVPYLAALAAANLLALAAVLVATRRPRRPRAAVRETARIETLENDPLESLVREVESAESASRFGAPGEARLAEDIRRWRRRYAADGDPLPEAAIGGRDRAGARA
jgi:hypothetical protein